MLEGCKEVAFEPLPGKVFARARVNAPNISVCCAAGLQGRRQSMEDAFCLHTVIDMSASGTGVFHLFAVFDGHGGHEAASFCKRHLQRYVQTALNEHLSRYMQEKHDDWVMVIRDALHCAIVCMNDAFEVAGGDAVQDVGSTAVVALVGCGRVWTANVGDSRAVLCRRIAGDEDAGTGGIPLSEDHSPSRVDERKRIEDAGGFIQYNPRSQVSYVGGILAMTRSIGDVSMRPFVTCAPDVTVHEIDASVDEFIVLATDGLWDVYSNTDAVKTLQSYFQIGRGIAQGEEDHNGRVTKRSLEDSALYAVRRLAHEAIYHRNTQDNVTIVMIMFQDAGMIQSETEVKKV